MTVRYFDNFQVIHRAGTIQDPFVPKEEINKVIIGNKIILEEIPDKFQRVTISGYIETEGLINIENKFKVDYTTGVVSFHPNKEGQTVPSISYLGRGVIRIWAERVATKDENGVEKSLQEVLDNAQSGISALSQLEVATENANSFKWMGKWNSTTTYNRNEMVEFDNSSFVCLQDHTNQQPVVTGSSYWGVMTVKGSTMNAVVDNSITVRNSTTSNSFSIRYGTSGGIEFSLN